MKHESRASITDEWYTPPAIFEALGLEFDLDPCAPRGGVPWVPAARSLSLDDDGLATPWEGRVWLNPPYGSQTAPFLGKLAEHGNGIALVFARTDTQWFQSCAPRAAALCFIARRVEFIRPDGVTSDSSPAPSCLIGYGLECGLAVHECGLGAVAELHPARPRGRQVWSIA